MKPPAFMRDRDSVSQAGLLVMIGVRADGRKELVALADGYREPAESLAVLVRDCRRGMTAAILAVDDGDPGFWKVIREVFPDTKEQRCAAPFPRR